MHEMSNVRAKVEPLSTFTLKLNTISFLYFKYVLKISLRGRRKKGRGEGEREKERERLL